MITSSSILVDKHVVIPLYTKNTIVIMSGTTSDRIADITTTRNKYIQFIAIIMNTPALLNFSTGRDRHKNVILMMRRVITYGRTSPTIL